VSSAAKVSENIHSKFAQNGKRAGFRLKIGLFEQKMTLGFILFTAVHAKWPKPAIKTLHKTQCWQENTFCSKFLSHFKLILYCFV